MQKVIVCIIGLLLLSSNAWAKPAVEFRDGLQWLNTDKPFTLQELRGKFVLLDFWTYACINCQHIIPDLKELEEKYPEELFVIGVHSAKFTTEKGIEHIRSAILRHDLRHPVINDAELLTWKDYGVSSWPTVVLISPTGAIIFTKSGEGVFEPVDSVLSKNIHKYDNVLNRKPLPFTLERDKEKKDYLRFPGKVLADENHDRLFIADSGNNRVLITDLQGQVLDVIGQLSHGQKDGGFDEAQFFHPQGLALDGQILFIADTENHLVRQADLESRQVTTIAGTGEQVFERDPHGPAIKQGLNSPWDLVVHNGFLYIAMAGAHQIWKIDLKSKEIELHAGSGEENIKDGNLMQAALAQPSGIVSDGRDGLYIADSEISGIRKLSIDPMGAVSTIIGAGLFEFGDIDGNYPKARLQHPVGILFYKDLLWVADTFNNKIKIIDPVNRVARTMAGDGISGMVNGPLLSARFNEPSGITQAKGKFYVADTNNHAVRVIDPQAKTVTSLPITPRDQPLRPKGPVLNVEHFLGEHKTVNALSSSIDNIVFSLSLPEGHKLLEESQGALRLWGKDGTLLGQAVMQGEKTVFPVRQYIDHNKVYLEALVYYCRYGKEAMCLFKDVLFSIEFGKSKDFKDIDIHYAIPMSR